MIRFAIAATTILLPFASLAAAQEHERPAADTQALGQTSFSTSCASEVQDDFDRAVAMLHSFWYKAAEQAFRAIASEDPSCAMAHWGVGMSRFRQLWETPGPEDVEAAQAALEKARTVELTSERERAYIAALERFYRNADRVDHLTRVVAYEGAMRELHERYPDDSEAAIFHALALLAIASASPPDRTFARQNEAAAILAGILPEQPEHPGVAHYLIHSSDYPPLAGRALEAARRYAEIAPGAPHALHMPSHIFTRLGLWQESILSNQAASAAARKDGWIGEELHTTDYLAYAYLQGAQDREAERILDMLPGRSAELSSDDTNYGSGIYAAAAIPARYAVERRRWTEAAAMEELGRCRAFLLGAGEAAEASGVNVGLWSNRLEMQRLGVEAWLGLAEGREEEALASMRAAADLEDSGDKPPTTPGSVVPARELLGEMLLEVGRPADALAEFERALEATPNRFRSLYGAARAADLAGDVERARQYYAQLLEVSRWADSERPEPGEAKRFLARERTGGAVRMEDSPD